MIMCEKDPNLVRWGLHLLQWDPSADSLDCENTSQIDVNLYDGDYTGESKHGTDHSVVENDEIIAHVLQEELSQVAFAEASGYSHADQHQLHAPILTQDWSDPPISPLVSVEGGEDMGTASSCSSPGEKSHDNMEPIEVEPTDEFSALDGEVGKRFDRLVPIAHVPRINGEIPSIDEAISDHQRLLGRLQLYDLVECKIQGDGNCQFRALSDQFYRTSEHHDCVRQQVVDQLKSHREMYEGYVPMAYDDYLEKMSKSGEWGDHVTLQAAADSYGVKIFILTSFKDTCYIEILPDVQKSKRVIFLSFWAEVHYNSIYPVEELPTSETETKNRKRDGLSEENWPCTSM